jgi:hypothetical protein
MSSSDQISALVQEVNAAAQAYSSSSSNTSSTSTSRHFLLAAARVLVSSLEDSEEEAWRFLLQPCAHACLTSAWQCGILDLWTKDVMTAKELAEKTTADERLVGEWSFQNFDLGVLLTSAVTLNLTSVPSVSPNNESSHAIWDIHRGARGNIQAQFALSETCNSSTESKCVTTGGEEPLWDVQTARISRPEFLSQPGG